MMNITMHEPRQPFCQPCPRRFSLNHDGQKAKQEKKEKKTVNAWYFLYPRPCVEFWASSRFNRWKDELFAGGKTMS